LIVALAGGGLALLAVAAVVVVVFLTRFRREDFSTWKEFTSAEGRFRVLMPGEPVKQDQVAPTPAGPITVHMFMDENKAANYSFTVGYNDIPPFAPRGNDDTMLDGVRTGALASFPGARLVGEQRIKLGSHPGRDLTIDLAAKGMVRQRIYLVGNRLYQLLVARSGSWPSAAAIDKFFDSFELIDNKLVAGGPRPDEQNKVQPPPWKGPPPEPEPVQPEQIGLPAEMKAPGEVLSWPQPHLAIQSLAFSPDGKTLATVGSDGSMTRLWDVATGKERLKLPGGVGFSFVVWSPDGSLLATQAGDNVVLRDGVTGVPVPPPADMKVGDLGSAAFSPDGKTLVAAGAGVKFWDVATRRELPPVTDNSRFLVARFVLGGKALLTVGHKGTERHVKVWDLARRTERAELKSFGTTWAKAEASPDGRFAATLDEGGVVKLADLQTGQTLHPIQGVLGGVTWFAFAADSRRLFTWGADGMVRLWDVRNTREQASFRAAPPGSAIHVLAVSADGRRLATAGRRRITIWDASVVLAAEAGRR
jgi:WD40 repeat protein